MANIVIATSKLIDAATLTALGTVASSLPITNLQDRQPARAARWTALAGMGVEIDFGAATAINCAALLYHNGTSAGTWRIRAADTQGNLTAAPGYDPGSASLWPPSGRPSGYDGELLSSWSWFGSSQSFRWWRIDIDDAANPDGYFDLGRLYLAAGFQPTRNYEFGHAIGRADPSPATQARGGQVWPEIIPNRAVQRLSLPRLTKAEALVTWHELERDRGTSKDLLVVPDPEATTYLHAEMIYGHLRALSGTRRAGPDQYAAAIDIEELRP